MDLNVAKHIPQLLVVDLLDSEGDTDVDVESEREDSGAVAAAAEKMG